MIYKVTFNDGTLVDIDVIEFGKDSQGGATLDHLADLHQGVKDITQSTLRWKIEKEPSTEGCPISNGLHDWVPVEKGQEPAGFFKDKSGWQCFKCNKRVAREIPNQ